METARFCLQLVTGCRLEFLSNSTYRPTVKLNVWFVEGEERETYFPGLSTIGPVFLKRISQIMTLTLLLIYYFINLLLLIIINIIFIINLII